MIDVLNCWTQAVLYHSEDAANIRTALIAAVQSGADLYGADLYEANLSRADLSGADLSRANLYGADLSGANLSGADLSGADLSGADLSGVDLSGADLSGVDLSGVDLSRANLSGANLSGADLSGANLSGADLSGANLSPKTKWPAPTMLLLAAWGETKHCADLMRYDASNHPVGPKAFTVWATGGACPYADCQWGRAANFQQHKSKWSARGRVKSALVLAKLLLKEKCVEVKA